MLIWIIDAKNNDPTLVLDNISTENSTLDNEIFAEVNGKHQSNEEESTNLTLN